MYELKTTTTKTSTAISTINTDNELIINDAMFVIGICMKNVLHALEFFLVLLLLIVLDDSQLVSTRDAT